MEGKGRTSVQIDWISVSVYLLLLLLGWIFIYSASYKEELEQGIFQIKWGYKGYEAGKQFLWIGIALLFFVPIILIVDIKFYFSTAYIVFGVIGFLFLLVLLIGQEVGGAVSWFNLGGIKIQPSEFGKFATALAVSKYINDVKPAYNISFINFMGLITKVFRVSSITSPIRLRFMPKLFLLLGIILFPMIMIVLQGDAGSALVYTSFIIVLFIDGLPSFIPVTILLSIASFIAALIFPMWVLYITIPVLGIIVFILISKKTSETILGTVLAIMFFVGVAQFTDFFVNNVLQDHQRKRIMVLFGLESKLEAEKNVLYEVYSKTPKSEKELRKQRRKEYRQKWEELRDLRTGDAYNITNSLVAISDGGFGGKGYRKGILHVPEQHTDFIFSRIGEEWGFMGTAFVVLLFLFLFIRLIYLAERQKSYFAKIYGYSVVSILFFHFVINIAMALGLFPVVGIPLPFFSYGGSGLWGFTVLIFIFLKLDMHRSQLLAR